MPFKSFEQLLNDYDEAIGAELDAHIEGTALQQQVALDCTDAIRKALIDRFNDEHIGT